MSDGEFMELALAEARRGLGRTAPNPAVGCVIAKGGVMLAKGYHHRAGQPHAEVEALSQLDGRAPGATAYVTLEPCNHWGRTGPCTEALLAAGVARVVVGTLDQNPVVAGLGAERLRAGGVLVEVGVREAECRRLIGGFRRWILTKEPRVVLKLASSLDGRIATASGESRWITGDSARAEVHRLRDEHDAVLVGAGTLRADDPALTTRGRPEGRDPIRVVLGSRAPLPNAQLFRAPLPARTIVALAPAHDRSVERFQASGVEIWDADLPGLFSRLGVENVTSVLVEGGAQLAAELFKLRRVDAVIWHVAPRFIGGDGRPSLDAYGLGALAALRRW